VGLAACGGWSEFQDNFQTDYRMGGRDEAGYGRTCPGVEGMGEQTGCEIDTLAAHAAAENKELIGMLGRCRIERC